jgi:hypothetical protein
LAGFADFNETRRDGGTSTARFFVAFSRNLANLGRLDKRSSGEKREKTPKIDENA